MKNPFTGTWTALITPFRNGELDLPALERLVEHQIAGGVDGLVPCGTTGESPTLSEDEQRRVVECVVRSARGRVPVCAGAGSNNTAHAVHLAKQAAKAGANGLLVVAPYYNRPSQTGLAQHFAAIASAVNLPIMLYNIPGRCGVEISVETIARLHSEYPGIVAVKHATGRVDGAADVHAASRIAVLSGDDPITLPLMIQGAVGAVSVLSNLSPKAMSSLTRAALAGDWPAAQAAHALIYPFARALMSLDTNPVPVKTAMAMRGACAEEFRLPMCPLSAENRGKLERLLETSSLD